MSQGPNVKRLIIEKMSRDAIPSGGGLVDGLRFLSDKGRIISTAKSATDWVYASIRLIREAAEPNPWKRASDEEIAAEILVKIKERRSTWTAKKL